ncbi:hypothetical protein EV715DRAFT_275719 [Schizophyllum commune]
MISSSRLWRSDVGQHEGFAGALPSHSASASPPPPTIPSSVCDWYKYWGPDLSKGSQDLRRGSHLLPSGRQPKEPMIIAIDEALKTYKERVAELEKEKAILEINVKQERYSASAQAKAARKETASLRKDLSATRAELTKAKEHVVDFTDIRNGLRKAARDLAAAISERDAATRGVAALREARRAVLFDVPRIVLEPCDGNLVERDAPLAEETAVRALVAGVWDALGRVAHSRMPLESADLLLARSYGSSDVGLGIVCVAMKRVLEEELERMQEECRKITRSSGCGGEAMEEKKSTPAALAEVITSEPATYGCTGVGASLASIEELSADDIRSTRQATISTILEGAHLPNDILSHLAGDCKALRANLDAARTAPAEEDVSLPATLHDVASARAEMHAARKEVKVWKREYVKWKDYRRLHLLVERLHPALPQPSVAGDGAKRFGDPEHAGRHQSRARRD